MAENTLAPEEKLPKAPPVLPDDEVLYELADLFRVFGDSTRIKILYALHDDELCVQDIANAVQLSQSAVSHQLRVLKDSKLVRFRRDGKTTANSLASTYMELAESYGATVQGIDTLEETIQLLTAGRIDATLNANVSFYDYLNVHPDADFKLVAQTEDASHVAIPIVKSDDSSFLDALNSAIDELRADGTLKELGEKYFGQDISSEN